MVVASYPSNPAPRAPRKRAVEEDDLITMGSSAMTVERINKILDTDRRMYYRSHDLNDKLYIHMQGFRKIENLEKFSGLRSLFAEANAFEKIEGLENCTKLRSLFIQQNCIRKIEGLHNCPEMWGLNLSDNWVETMENLAELRCLSSLTIVKNRIGVNGLSDLMELKHTTIGTLDLSDNFISDPECLPEVFCKMKHLRVLYLKGNPVVKQIPHYRKTVIASLPELRYLDDRPVFEEDRRYAEAFVAGGLEGEREMRRIVKQEKADYHTRQVESFQKMVAEAKERKRETRGMRANDKYTDETDPVETWKKKQERFIRENPQYDYEVAGAWDKKLSGDTTKVVPKLDVNAPPAPESALSPEEEKISAAKPGTKAAELEKKMEDSSKKTVEAPPAPDWDADIFGSAPSQPAQPVPSKASKPFAPPPRNPEKKLEQKPVAAFGPRGKDVNELDELD
jgi:dynein assembly factor 1